ncbi:MoaD/ThiS family protein [Arthrobacter agilis]|uniref:MoaD/ThiS family protein n=1 Tax=Arthrobacter agilis TaxID=37921 RepID=UPI000B35194E|nr:MoaD/ThiS family protein [Arthrobacter agilis]OUM40790.1 molybdopterin synthase sulfur carrier subunit [Arthrobacter agilis]PPB45394.1 MoaD/ThiS family protein [Arthrobacter agilis]TPV28106.1 MoaD/ThiS family protein [Arthrobacter agilis]
MLVRYFGAAKAASGVDQERLPAGRPLTDLLTDLRRRPATPGSPSLGKVLDRSSFLLNEVALRDRATVLRPDDVLDILPPFAGG